MGILNDSQTRAVTIRGHLEQISHRLQDESGVGGTLLSILVSQIRGIQEADFDLYRLIGE